MSAFMVSVFVSVFVLSYGRYSSAVPYYVRSDPPYFSQQPQSSKFLPGNNPYTVTLNCAVRIQNIVSGYNMVKIHWVFNGSIVKGPKFPGGEISSDTAGQSTLTFRHPNESNAGRYHCVMQDGLFSIVSETAELTLYEFSGFIEPAPNITAYRGENIYIDCRATTNALQVVTWYKDLQSLQSEPERIVAMPDAILIISNVTDLDAGNYTCRLTVLSQYKEKTVEVRIKIPTADSSQLRFSYKPQNRSVLVNEKGVYLLCVATGNVSSYKWLKDGVSIQDSGIEYQLAAGGSILNFTNITDRIQGVYSCVVESEASQIIQSKAWIHILTPPVIDGSMSTSDFPIEIDSDNVFETLHCHIKRCSPPPTVVWLHNGIPIDINDTGIIIFAQRVMNTATGFDYALRIISENSTYQFVLDNIIGMYQCIVSNEAGHVIIGHRVLFKYKPNPVDRPILHNPGFDNGCSFLVEWNHTDHYYFSKSHRNYIVYMSIDGTCQRARGCINKHSTSCVVRYDITEIRFGKYTAAVQAVFSIEDELPDRVSDLSEFSNMVQLNHMTYPKNAVKPCEMSCRSFAQNSDIHMDVSWNLCPYEDFTGYVDNYVVILDCSADYLHAPARVLNYTAPPGLLNYTFQQVPCFQNCELVVKKHSSNFKANSNSSITCGRTPKLRPQSAVYNVTVKRTEDPDIDIDVGINFKITFDLPPLYEICSSDDVEHISIKWKGYKNTENLQRFDTRVLEYMGHGSVPLKVGDEDRWKAVSIAISFTTSVGLSPWSKWHNVSSAKNGDIKESDIKFKINGTTTNSITVGWILNARAESMKQANFILKFQYTINLTGTTNDELITSSDSNYTFYNLSAGTTYHIVGKVLTSDNVTDPPTNLVIIVNGKTLDLIEPTTDYNATPTVSIASKEGLSDTVIIVITVCVALVVLASIIALICQWKSGKCRANRLAMQSNVVSHHLLTKNSESPETSTEPSTQSDIGVPTTPKKELVKKWLNSADRNNPPGSDGQHGTYLPEIGRSELGQDNEINYMLNQIISKPSFVLEAVPKMKKVTRAEVHRLPVENELESSYFASEKEGDYAKIAYNAPGASTSGDSKQCVLMDNFVKAPELSSNRNETTLFSTASSKPSPKHQEYSELVVSKQVNSISHSSGSLPYLENNEESSGCSPPYLENEHEQLLTEINGAKKPSHDCVNNGYAGNITHATPSILSSSHPSEGSSNSFQGEGYVTESDMLLLNGTFNQNTHLQGNYQRNQKFTNGIAFNENVLASKYGQYIDNNMNPADAPSKANKKSPEGSSVDSDCIGSNDNYN